jgi:cell division transport system ATP-binding protein
MIDFKNVSKIYLDTVIALDDVTLNIQAKEFAFIVGPSGAGKSTLLKLLIRQDFPSQGEIFFEDIDVVNIPKKLISVYRQQMGITFQDLKLIECRTAKENIEFALEITGKTKKEMHETTDYLLDLVNLKDRQNLLPIQLSGGEKQKVAIARALANDPKILIADEPTGNLDPHSALEILDILKTINSLGTTILAITHDHDIVNKMQKRVIALEKGKIVSDEIGGYKYINVEKKVDIEKEVKERKETKDEQEEEKKSEKEDKVKKKETKKEEESEISILKLSKTLEKKLLENKFDTFDKLLDITEEDIEKAKITQKQLEEITQAIAKLKEK